MKSWEDTDESVTCIYRHSAKLQNHSLFSHGEAHIYQMETSKQLKGKVHHDSMSLPRFHTNHGNL
jgi:hypothetical protein